MTKKAEILWCDMEMTGLDPAIDRSLEIALIATDWDMNEIARYESGILQDPDLIETRMKGPFFAKNPMLKPQMRELSVRSPAPTAVDVQLCSFVKEHFDTSRPVLLAGNSIHQDRRFIRRELPFFDQLLHYRMLDVSAWKVVFESKFGTSFTKKESHRALEDIKESIAELQFFLEKIPR